MKQPTAPGESIPIRFRADVVADWLLRTVLPRLLEVADHDRLARILSAHEPMAVTEALRDAYAASRLTATLRDTRRTLRESIDAENRWALVPSTPDTIRTHGGLVRLRATCFPHLDDITEHVARVAPMRDLGPLLRSDVHLAIELIARKTSHDQPTGRAEPLTAAVGAYEGALRELVQHRASDSATPRASFRIRVDEIRGPRGQLGFQGTILWDGVSEACPHRHLQPASARSCALRIARRGDPAVPSG